MSVIHYQCCPLCGGTNIRPVLQVKDFTVSLQTFGVWECGECSLRFTQDVPGQDTIGDFYRSEDYISHSDTRKGLVNTAYHLVRNYTLKKKRDLMVQSLGKPNGRILDIGAGTGAFLDIMKKGGWQVTGLEPDEGARQVARAKYGLELMDLDALQQLGSKSFDVVTLWHVLEHVHTLHDYISSIRNLLVPGGIIVLALPNYRSLDADIYGENWAAYDVPRHLYHFSPDAVKKLFSLHDLRLQKLLPMWFDSFYISLLSEQYRFGKQGYVRAFLNGLKSNKKAFSHPENASSVIYIASA